MCPISIAKVNRRARNKIIQRWLYRRSVTSMDKDRIKGSAEQAKGKIKEVAGKMTGDAKLESEGKADKAAGKIRNAVGGIKDALRGN